MHRGVFPILIALAAGAAPVQSEGFSDVVSLEVRPGWRTEAGTHMAGFHLRLEPGWKTYWRAPGAAGIPPIVTWTGSDNIAGAAFHWPVPEVDWNNGLRSIGYSDEVVIPVEIAPQSIGAEMRISGTLEIGVCRDVCIPVQLDFQAELPSGGDRDGPIVSALIDRPLSGEEAGVTGVRCRISPAETGVDVTAAIDMPSIPGVEEVVIESRDPMIWADDARSDRRGGTISASARMWSLDGGPVAIDRSDIRITVIGSQSAVDIHGCTG